MQLQRRSRLIGFFENATLLYPFTSAATLYICWVLTGSRLGHEPVAWTDDPAEVLGLWIYVPVSWLAVFAALPVNITSIYCNVAIVVKRRSSAVQAGIRILSVSSVWLWYWTWVYREPYEILKWWVD
jgi:hypothetical protein